MVKNISYKDWHFPIQRKQSTLAEASASLQQVGADQEEIPFIVRLVENPNLKLAGGAIFHGAVELHHHDLIHIVLGRGLLEIDEAFTIGFTMGSSKKVSATEENLFAWIAKNLYPDSYRFSDPEIRVFKDAVRLGFISQCRALDNIDFSALMQLPLNAVRETLRLETDLLLAYYRIEQRRYPDSVASQRLLDD